MSLDVTDPDAPVAAAAPPRAGPFEHQWTMTRHADVAAVLRSPDFAVFDVAARAGRIGGRTGRDFGDLLALLGETMVFQNGDKHRRCRRAVAGLLGSGLPGSDVAGADKDGRDEADLLARARAIVAGLPAAGEVDAVPTLAAPLPTIVLAALLGLDAERCGALRALALTLTQAWLPSASMRVFESAAASATTLRDALAPFAGAGTPIAGLATGDPDERPADLAVFLLIAGAESIAGTIAAALDLLARDPALQERLRADPAAMPGFIRETLRLCGPLRRLNRRVALADVVVGGAAIRAGDVVVLRTDAAHRDPAAFAEPDRIDLARKGAALLAFGGGAHVCQGPRLGAAEAEAMVRAVLERYRLAPGSSRGRLFAHEDWRVFETLPLTLAPVDAAGDGLTANRAEPDRIAATADRAAARPA